MTLICAWCKKEIKRPSDIWEKWEITDKWEEWKINHEISHGICRRCRKLLAHSKGNHL